MSEATVLGFDVLAAVRDERAAHTWAPLPLTLLGAAPPEPPTMGGLVYPGRVHVWSGEPESMKSLAALAIAADEVRAGRSVLWLDHENGPRETLARLHALGLTDEEVGRGFLYLAPVEALTPASTGYLAAVVEEHRPVLVVVDSYTASLALHGCDDNRGVEIERHAREVLRPLRATEAAVVLLDHVTKNPANRGRYSIASERKVGGADVHLSFEVASAFGRGRRGVVHVLTQKDRPAWLNRPRAAALEFTSDAETGAIDFRVVAPSDQHDVGSFRPTVVMERVSRFVEQQAEPVSRNVIEKAGLGKAATVRHAVGFLLMDGFLRETEGRRNSRPVESVRPYREGDLVPTSSLDEAPTSSLTSSRQEPLSDAL